jgi:hypothetical protein
MSNCRNNPESVLLKSIAKSAGKKFELLPYPVKMQDILGYKLRSKNCFVLIYFALNFDI